MKLQWSKTLGKMTWEEAVKFCEELEFDGKKDWRLPTLDELRALHASDEHPHNDTKTVACYWSSTTFADDTGSALFVSFSDGYAGVAVKTYMGYVRAVRNVKEGE